MSSIKNLPVVSFSTDPPTDGRPYLFNDVVYYVRKKWMTTTLVTCLYDIRAKERQGETPMDDVRTLSNYLELGRHVLTIDLPMVFFTDDDEISSFVLNERRHLVDKTVVVSVPFEDTIFYKDLDVLKERMNTFHLTNLNEKKDTPFYNILMYNKFDFMDRAIEMNHFQSEYFIWMDFGINHCAKAEEIEYTNISLEWPLVLDAHPHQIHHLRIHTVMKPSDMAWKDYFKTIYHHIAGGLFAGHKTSMKKYIEMFREQFRRIVYDEGWWQLDEAIMTILTETHPTFFRFWYGDYDGIITNFVRSKRSFHLIFQTIQRYLDARDYTRCEEVLSTLDDVMFSDHSSNSLLYLSKRICCDYYRWDKNFSPSLEKWLLNKDQLDQVSSEWLRSNIQNLKFYTHPDTIGFWVLWTEKNPANKDVFQRLPRLRQSLLSASFHSVPIGVLTTTIAQQYPSLLKPEPTFLDGYAGTWEHLLNLFQTQFPTEPDHEKTRLYALLETPQHPLFFLSISTIPETELQKEQLAQTLLSGYIERNFPSLDFYILIFDTHPCYITHPRVFSFLLDSPFDDTSSPQFSHLFSQWFQAFLSSTE